MADLNRTLQNGMRMLELMSASMRDYSVVELAREMGIPKSHSHRLLQTLVALGYVSRDPRTRAYRMDVKLLELASAIAEGHPLRNRAGSVLRELASATGGTSVLSVWNLGAPLSIMADTCGGRRDGPFYEFGRRMPLSTSAAGKLFCALLDVDVSGIDLPAVTDRSITSQDEFARELDRIRSDGYAVTLGESEPEIAAVAAPVRDHAGALQAAVGVAVHLAAPTRAVLSPVIGKVLTAADRLSRAADPENSARSLRA